MGQDLSQEISHQSISVDNAKCRSSNSSMTAARFHSGKRGWSFKRRYEVANTVLGRGKHSTVVNVTHRALRRRCALKAFNKRYMSAEAVSFMVAEVEILLGLDHPNIVRVHDVYEPDHESVYMVMECCTGGELYYRLLNKGRLPEVEVAEAVRQMVQALSYLHSRNVVHRDLKLENFLYATEEHKTLKLIDFGFARVCDGRTLLQETCGTRDYVSPEVLLHEGYSNTCDLWSLGVIVFMLLTGCTPIHADSTDMLNAKIRRGEVEWSLLSRRTAISADGEDFLRALLTKDPEQRLDAQTAMFHPWLIRTAASSANLDTLREHMLHSLHQYADSTCLRRVTLQMIAWQLTAAESEELTSLFTALSKGNCGSIDLERLEEDEARRRKRFSGDSPMTLPTQVSSLSELLEVLDVNGDGQVYYSDFLAAMLCANVEVSRETYLDVFDRFDVDGSGSITAGNLTSMLGDRFGGGVDCQEIIAEADPNGSGEISLEAFMRIVKGETSFAGGLGGDPC